MRRRVVEVLAVLLLLVAMDTSMLQHLATSRGQAQQPVLQVSPASLNFLGHVGGPTPAPQAFTITNAGDGLLDWHVMTDVAWLTLGGTKGALSAGRSIQVQVVVRTDSLQAETYRATVAISASGAQGSPTAIAVTLTITGPPGVLEVTPTTLAFRGGGSDPPTQPLSVWNTGGSALTWTAAVDASWVTLTPSRGELAVRPSAGSTQAIQVSVRISGLPAGSQRATITVTAPGARNSPARVSLTLTVVRSSAVRVLEGHYDVVRSVVFNPDGRLLASGSNDGTIKFWQVATGRVVNTLSGHDSWVRAVAFSPNGQLLASGAFDETIKLWEVATGNLVRTIQERTGRVVSIAFSPDGKLLASSSDYSWAVKLWDVDTGRNVRILVGHDNYVNSVAFSTDGQMLASGSFDNTASLWEVETGRVLRTLQGHEGSVNWVAFSPDGRLLATASSDTSLRLWDVATGQETRTLQDHTYWVTSVAFSPNGKLLASGSADKTIKLWDVATGQVLRTIEEHDDWVFCVAFSPKGDMLASASDDKTVRLWDVSALVGR